jgi:tRNA (guanine10-N2)-dimethyltransferase
VLNIVDFKSYLEERGKRIAVRVLRLGNVDGERIESLEREIGRLVISKVPNLKVDLNYPQIVLVGILAEDFFLLGMQKGPIQKKPFFQRRPRKRPFFHATAMSVKLSRCMVNLTKSKSGALILDPFCGTGSILLEAGLMGFRIVGGDVQRRMVTGAYANLKYFGLDPGLIVHDAHYIPFRFADCVVTDPPYGRSTTTLGLDVREILKVFFQELTNILAKGSCVCLAFPRELDVKEIGIRSGFEFVESHLVYVHKSLTREIAVFRKSN